MKIGVIFAMDEMGGIGYNGGLPWTPHKKDFAQFKDQTMGKPMIMGRRTFDSLPGILPGREHMVITANPDSLPDHEMVYCARDLADALDQYTCGSGDDVEMVWIIGGKRVIEEAVKVADVVRITTMYTEYSCDVWIDPKVLVWLRENAVRVQEVERGENHDYWITEYHMKHA